MQRAFLCVSGETKSPYETPKHPSPGFTRLHTQCLSTITVNRTERRIIEDLPAPAQSSETEFEKCLAPLLSSLPDKYRDAIEFVSPALASWFCGQASRAAKNKPASAWWPERV